MGVVTRSRVYRYTVAASMTCLFVYSMYCMVTTPAEIICVFDDSLSIAAQSEIDTYIHTEFPDGNVSIAACKEAFPYLESCDVRAVTGSARVVQCRASRPCVAVQDDKVVTKSGYIVSSALFTACALAECKQISLAPYLVCKKRLSSSDVESLMRVPVKMCSEFMVVWHRPTEIYCVDKKDAHSVVVVTDTVDVDRLIGSLSHKVIAQSQAHASYARCVDVRFENQLIVRQMDRGSYEKKIVC